MKQTGGAKASKRRKAGKTRITLLQKIIEAQEDERKRIARDIHDHIGQQIIGLKLKLHGLSEKYKADPDLIKHINEIQSITEQMDSEVDFLAWELRPSVLDNLGLTASLKNFVHEWSDHFKIEAEFQAFNLDGQHLLPEVEINLYRIAQEALNNVAKHAKPGKVSVLLELRNGFLILIVEDDGIGFEPRQKSVLTRNDRGMGLLGMKERAELIGGTIEIESAPGKGTTVYARVPASFEEAKI
jgi:signal transduction histidine kinase